MLPLRCRSWLVALLLGHSVLFAADPPVVLVTDHGVDLTDDQPDDDGFSKALQLAVEQGGICRIGPGTLTLTKYPAELRQDGKIETNRDLRGLIIEGAGADETTVHGVSARGFDVFQLNGVENLTIRRLAITAAKTTNDQTQGVNGVSMTNGTAKVRIEQVAVRKLPYVLKPNRFDGGKAFTVQQGTFGAVSCTDIEIRDCAVSDTPIGFGLDADPNQAALPGKIVVRDNRFERVSLGFSLSFSAKKSGGVDVPGFGIEITGNTLVDVTRVMFVGRAPDVVFRNNTATTTDLPELPDPIIHPGVPLVVIGGVRGRIEDNRFEYQSKVPAFLLIGGAAGNGNTDRFVLSNNEFSGPAVVGVLPLNPGITNSRFAGNTFAGVGQERDRTLVDPKLKNTWAAKAKSKK
jgi:hypothetical protein